MPFVAGVREATTNPVRERLAEFARPLPHRFVANDDSASHSNSSTIRSPSGNRKYIQTAWRIISEGNR